MAIKVRCECGRVSKAHESFAGKRAACPGCGRVMRVPELVAAATPAMEPIYESNPREAAMDVTEFFDPPDEADKPARAQRQSVLRRMFEALLDPRSIQWMLMIGGGMLVLGLVVLLVNLLDLKAPLIVAGSMGIGTVAVLAGGWYLTLKTSHKTAGRALTFLACVVAPLNLWYYHAHDLITIQNHLWIGGVVCSLLYIATVRILRDPLFLYAVEVGVTLTVLLFLPVVHVNLDAATVSLSLLALGAISIHSERGFAAGGEEFSREKFGLPLFWSGQVQTGVALLVLLGSQILGWLDGPIARITGYGFQGNLLTTAPLIAGTLWLVGAYLYLYSDFAVRRIGVYIYAGAFCLLMAIVTLVGWQFDTLEPVIMALAVVALGVNLSRGKVTASDDKLGRLIAPLGLILSGIPLFIGWVVHIRSNSLLWSPVVPIEWMFVVAMLVVTVGNRISAYLLRESNFQQAAVYLFFSAAGLMLAAAGLLPLIGLEQWYQQAPLLMLIPIGYMIASRLWRGQSPERPLVWIAHTATGIVLFHVLLSTWKAVGNVIQPVSGELPNLLLGLVFAEAAVVYVLAGLFRKRSVNAYFAAAALCGAIWQWLGYFDVPGSLHTMLYAVLGLAALITARSLGLEETKIYNAHGDQALAIRGRGLTAFQSGNAILSIALLSVFWQGVMRLFGGETIWSDDIVLLLTTGIAFAAIRIVPSGDWRRVYLIAACTLAGLAFLTITLPWLKQLTLGEKVELVSVLIGIGLLIGGHIGRFRETGKAPNEAVGVSLALGSVLATFPLLIAVIYHRWGLDVVSFRDELAILGVTIVMLVVGLSWQTKAPTLIGGFCLTIYLVVLIAELAMRAEQLLGIAVFMAIVGGVVFALGVLLSIYREKLLALPDAIANRTGIFKIMNWR